MKRDYMVLVSVVIPTYNAARTLPTARRFIKTQTYHNIVDRFSEDSTQDIETMPLFSSTGYRLWLFPRKLLDTITYGNSGAYIKGLEYFVTRLRALQPTIDYEK